LYFSTNQTLFVAMLMDKRQPKVWQAIKKARTLLKSARTLELKIEQERVRLAVSATRQFDHYPDSGVTDHDPLGRKLDRVIEDLEELID
jgi:hypothetical protein